MARGAKLLGLSLVLFIASMLSAEIAGLGFNVTGGWTVKISTPTGQILGFAELTQSGRQVTGWFQPNGGDPIPVSGVLMAGKLIITTHPEPRHLVAFDRCEMISGGNHMKGKFYPGSGKIEFIKVREPRLPSRPWHPLGTPLLR